MATCGRVLEGSCHPTLSLITLEFPPASWVKRPSCVRPDIPAVGRYGRKESAIRTPQKKSFGGLRWPICSCVALVLRRFLTLRYCAWSGVGDDTSPPVPRRRRAESAIGEANADSDRYPSEYNCHAYCPCTITVLLCQMASCVGYWCVSF